MQGGPVDLCAIIVGPVELLMQIFTVVGDSGSMSQFFSKSTDNWLVMDMEVRCVGWKCWVQHVDTIFFEGREGVAGAFITLNV